MLSAAAPMPIAANDAAQMRPEKAVDDGVDLVE